MLFNSFAFLVFLPIFMAAYWASSGRLRLWVMLVGSLIFYAWWDWRFLFLLAFSGFFDYAIGLLLDRDASDGVRRRFIAASIAVNLGVLGFFKYFNFFAESAVRLAALLGLHTPWHAMQIALPVGISFYVFKTMSYTIDVYRRTEPAERDLLRFMTFVVFFPELVAGPIVRASRLLPQMARDHRLDFHRALSGTTLVLSGYVRKVVIADSLAPIVDVRFAHPEAHSAISLLVAVYFYAFQIYCDFSGYSNIAIGLARILGFDFGVNFDRPYFSRNFREFWTRWHISLSSWLRDYLYVPLGGNRGGRLATARNLMITMLLGGLWHGASWTFVAWGGLHGLYLAAERALGPRFARVMSALRVPGGLVDAFLILLVFHLTCVGWLFFRAPTFQIAWQMLSAIVSMDEMSVASIDNKILVAKGAAFIAGLLLIELAGFLSKRRRDGAERAADAWRGRDWGMSPAWRLALAASCVWLLLLFGSFSSTPFIYFQF